MGKVYSSRCPYKAGELVYLDYRPHHENQAEYSASFTPALKCIQWNIERGYKLDEIIEILKYHDADIICLQELDVGCERSSFRDCAEEITKALQMKCALLVEFEEFYSLLRNKATQGGGIHGNAILSRFDLTAQILPHTHHPVDWEKHGIDFGEPRKGKRAILRAEIDVPGMSMPIVAYSLHFEVYTGIFGRLKQFSDITRAVKKSASSRPYQLVFGDLNTLAHGIARLSRLYCRDEMRFGSLGYTEAAWWESHILIHTKKPGALLQSLHPRMLTKEEVDSLVNPYLFDPFCVVRDTSLQGYRGLYQGKLDWTLLRGFRVLAKGMDNNDYQASDHKLLYVVVRPVKSDDIDDGEVQNPGEVAYKEYRRHHYRPKPTNYGWITLMMIVVAVFVLPLINTLRG